MYTWHCIEQLELWYQCVSTFVHGIIEHYSGVNSASTNQNFAVISNSFVAKDQKACLYVFWILLSTLFSAGRYKISMLLEFIVSNKSSKIFKYEAKVEIKAMDYMLECELKVKVEILCLSFNEFYRSQFQIPDTIP